MWIEALPRPFVVNMGVFGLIITGFLVEKHYVSRPAIFANGIALNVHVYGLALPPDWLVLYANIGIAMSAIAMISYATEASLPEGYYDLVWLSYSSIIVGVVILATIIT